VVYFTTGPLKYDVDAAVKVAAVTSNLTFEKILLVVNAQFLTILDLCSAK
jgi:hypothetical protein